MNRIAAFSERNCKELLRDPLSYLFCLGFPVVMLVVMTLVDQSIPKESGLTIFRIDALSGGVAVFGQTFVMLFTALTVSKDRNGAFLVRMYATPMRSVDFLLGYLLPMLVVALLQCAVTDLASLVISWITGVPLSLPGLLLSLITLLPSALLFAGLGLLFGTLFSEKAAPGFCSIVISLGSFLGGIWFDAEGTGGVLLTLCKCLPFFYCTKIARSAIALDCSVSDFWLPLLIVSACAAVVLAIACLAFRRRMRADLS